MKILIILVSILLITGCLSRAMQPLGDYYETYRSRHTNDEQIKQDMKACGFPNVRNTGHYFVHHHNEYVASSLCMERKGYKDNSLPKGVCHRYPDSLPCQTHQKKN